MFKSCSSACRAEIRFWTESHKISDFWNVNFIFAFRIGKQVIGSSKAKKCLQGFIWNWWNAYYSFAGLCGLVEIKTCWLNMFLTWGDLWIIVGTGYCFSVWIEIWQVLKNKYDKYDFSVLVTCMKYSELWGVYFLERTEKHNFTSKNVSLLLLDLIAIWQVFDNCNYKQMHEQSTENATANMYSCMLGCLEIIISNQHISSKNLEYYGWLHCLWISGRS